MESVVRLPIPAKRSSRYARLLLLAISCLSLTYYALRHGAYSLVDRQQLALLLWAAIGIAAVCGLLPAVRPQRILLMPLLALLALATWALLSLFWTESAERTFNEFARIVGYLGVLVLIWAGVGRRSWRLVSAGLLSAGVLVSCLIVASRLWPGAFPTDTVAINFHTTRINYPFGYWNAVGCWSAMTIALCLAYAADARSGLVRALSLAAVPVSAVALYLALSRAGIGGAAIGATVVVLLARWRWLALIQAVFAAGAGLLAIKVVRGTPAIADATGSQGAGRVIAMLFGLGLLLGAVAWAGARFELGPRLRLREPLGRRLGIAAAALAVFLAIAAAALFGGRAWDQFVGKNAVVVSQDPSARLGQLSGNRHNIWSSAGDAFAAHPVGGTGPGTFEFWWSRKGVNSEFVRDAHNIYLEALAETGAVGLLLLLTFFVGLLLAAWLARCRLLENDSAGIGVHAGLIAVFAVFLFQAGVDWMWESTAVAVFALAAVALAGASAGKPREEPLGATRPLVLAVISLLAVIVMLSGLANARQIEQSQVQFRAGDAHAALAHADDAINAQRWSATAWSQRALSLDELGRPRAALAAIREAERIEPFNWRWPLVESRLQVALGEPSGAAAALRRAERLRPFLAIFGRRSPELR
jgi:tetratricopeptide (TPR) repeat protein